jgi:hypothetical protein
MQPIAYWYAQATNLRGGFLDINARFNATRIALTVSTESVAGFTPMDEIQRAPHILLLVKRAGTHTVAMHSGMARRAKSHQVFLCIGSEMAAKLTVVHLKVRHRATRLASPAVATKDLLSKIFIR